MRLLGRLVDVLSGVILLFAFPTDTQHIFGQSQDVLLAEEGLVVFDDEIDELVP